jgi:hypothetical protein
MVLVLYLGLTNVYINIMARVPETRIHGIYHKKKVVEIEGLFQNKRTLFSVNNGLCGEKSWMLSVIIDFQ